MPYKIQLTYFRQTGKFLATAEAATNNDKLVEIWEEIDDLRRLGRLPLLRPGAGRDLFVMIDVPDHPERVLHMVMPPFHDDDDITPPRIPTGEMLPLVRVPLAEIPRTTTRDVVHPPPQVEVEPDVDTVVALHDDDCTPPDYPLARDPSTREPDDKPKT